MSSPSPPPAPDPSIREVFRACVIASNPARRARHLRELSSRAGELTKEEAKESLDKRFQSTNPVGAGCVMHALEDESVDIRSVALELLVAIAKHHPSVRNDCAKLALEALYDESHLMRLYCVKACLSCESSAPMSTSDLFSGVVAHQTALPALRDALWDLWIRGPDFSGPTTAFEMLSRLIALCDQEDPDEVHAERVERFAARHAAHLYVAMRLVDGEAKRSSAGGGPSAAQRRALWIRAGVGIVRKKGFSLQMSENFKEAVGQQLLRGGELARRRAWDAVDARLAGVSGSHPPAKKPTGVAGNGFRGLERFIEELVGFHADCLRLRGGARATKRRRVDSEERKSDRKDEDEEASSLESRALKLRVGWVGLDEASYLALEKWTSETLVAPVPESRPALRAARSELTGWSAPDLLEASFEFDVVPRHPPSSAGGAASEDKARRVGIWRFDVVVSGRLPRRARARLVFRGSQAVDLVPCDRVGFVGVTRFDAVTLALPFVGREDGLLQEVKEADFELRLEDGRAAGEVLRLAGKRRR